MRDGLCGKKLVALDSNCECSFERRLPPIYGFVLAQFQRCIQRSGVKTLKFCHSDVSVAVSVEIFPSPDVSDVNSNADVYSSRSRKE